MSIDLNALQDFAIILTGIIIQAFPFLMLGTMVSSIIRIFASDEFIIKLFPKKGILASFSSIIVGVFLPLCDCAVIPVAVRLKRKGVPVHAVISFIMAAPIVNPIVIIATFYAFGLSWKIALYRIVVGIIIAILSGFFLGIFYSGKDKDSEILKDNLELDDDEHNSCCGHKHTNEHSQHCDHLHHTETVHEHKTGQGCGCNHDTSSETSMKSKITHALVHTGDEFFQVSRLFIIGASISATIQTFFPKDILMNMADGLIPAVFIMMIVAFIMSICSTSDAFIARSFINIVPMQGVFAFIVFGPAVDLKNTIMMSGFFKKKFIVEYIFVAFVTALVILSIAGSLLF